MLAGGSNRFQIYFVCSVLLAGGVIFHAYSTRVQFYPTVVYLVTSKFNIMALVNMTFVSTIVLGQFTKSVFLGTLRDAEVEMLMDNSRYAVTETCLALTIFREEINLKVLALFTALIFTKIFHWLCQSRLEHMEQAENVRRLSHARIISLMTTLAIVDMLFVVMCALNVAENGPTVLVLFGFEFLVLYITLNGIFIRYIFHMIDLRADGNWENKSTYLFYLELFTEVTKLFVYLVFFMIIFTYYGMPLHLVRDLWTSIKSLQRRIETYFRYRRITQNLNTRFPNPTEEELSETDRTCIICREDMVPESSKKLFCGHIFHAACLRSWLQHQQTCPTCREPIERPAAASSTVPAPVPAPNAAAVPAAEANAVVPPAAPVPAVNETPQVPDFTAAAAAVPQGVVNAAVPSTSVSGGPYEMLKLQQEMSMMQLQLFHLTTMQPRVPSMEQMCQSRINEIQRRLTEILTNGASTAATATAASSTAPPPPSGSQSEASSDSTLEQEEGKVEASESEIPEAKPAATENNLRQRRVTSTDEGSEAQRRREEMRQRYGRIYQSKVTAASSSNTEETKED